MYNIRLFGIETRNSPLYNEYMLIKMKKKKGYGIGKGEGWIREYKYD
jgi:hypothetical protein